MIPRSELPRQLAPENLTSALGGLDSNDVTAKIARAAQSRNGLARLREKVLDDRELTTTFGRRELGAQFDRLVQRTTASSAGRDFQGNVEKKGSVLGTSLSTIKNIVTYPARHPFKTLLAAAAAYAGVNFAFKGAAGLEAMGVNNAIQKALQFFRSDLSLAGGKSGVASEGLKNLAPGEI